LDWLGLDSEEVSILEIPGREEGRVWNDSAFFLLGSTYITKIDTTSPQGLNNGVMPIIYAVPLSAY
jgi:hypothetical protein